MHLTLIRAAGAPGGLPSAEENLKHYSRDVNVSVRVWKLHTRTRPPSMSRACRDSPRMGLVPGTANCLSWFVEGARETRVPKKALRLKGQGKEMNESLSRIAAKGTKNCFWFVHCSWWRYLQKLWSFPHLIFITSNWIFNLALDSDAIEGSLAEQYLWINNKKKRPNNDLNTPKPSSRVTPRYH